jgi:hypothetical protein
VWIENVKSYITDKHGRIYVLTPALSSPQRTQQMGQTVQEQSSPVLALVPPNEASVTE